MQVALITGGAGGIGRAIALRLARDGFAVAVVDRDRVLGAETCALVKATGVPAEFFEADVSDGTQVAAFVKGAEDALGPIAAFVNNAGVEGAFAPIFDYPEEAFDQVFAVNAKGAFLCLKHVLARMREHGAGAVVNLASTSSIRGRAGLAGYVASKHALLGLTRVAALDMAGTAIRVNAVLPGPVETRMIREIDRKAGEAGRQIQRGGASSYAQPEQIADVVAFLLSEQASHVNGAAWTVDAASTVA